MRIILDLTPEQYRAGHDALAYLLRPKAVREDPDSADLLEFFMKLAESRDQAVCEECYQRVVYARGRCKACYRLQSA